MFWGKPKSLTSEEISFRGKVAALMIVLSSSDLIDNHSGDVPYPARSLAGIKDEGRLTETEKDLARELTYLGIVGLADGAKKFFNDNDSINTFVGSATMVLKKSWPDHPTTKRYFSGEANSLETLYKGVISRRALYRRIVDAFVKTYKNRSTIFQEELERRADQTLAEGILAVGKQTATLILSATNEEVQKIAKNISG